MAERAHCRRAYVETLGAIFSLASQLGHASFVAVGTTLNTVWHLLHRMLLDAAAGDDVFGVAPAGFGLIGLKRSSKPGA